jgi:hypothetical protein
MTTMTTETNENATMTTTNTKAFDAGLKDGAEWDLDGC